MEYVIGLLVACLTAWFVYSRRPLPANFFTKRMEAAYAPAEAASLPFYRGVLAGFQPLVKYTPLGWLKALEQQLYWSQLAGRWTGWSVTEAAALHAALTVVGAILGVLFRKRNLIVLYKLGDT